ncbi:MAG TPA: hypothetical protein VF731_01740 [Solirubrobacterales bacterium]
MAAESFTCPECGAVSHHPRDIEFGYCGRCHEFTGGEEQRLTYLRAAMLSEVTLRGPAEKVVQGMLAELADLDDDDPVPAWHDEEGRDLLPGWAADWTVGELRRRLRVMLEDLATAETEWAKIQGRE